MLISPLAGLASTLRTRTSLQVEILALRHQLAVLQRTKRKRFPLRATDRLLWVALLRLWPEWRKALVLVKPETVIGWHRRGFRFYWIWKSRGRGDLSWPCEGGMGEDRGLTAFRNVGYGPERPDHTRWAESGQTSTGIVVLTKPIRSWTYAPLGQSDRPDSPHFRDQAEKAFSPRKLKSTWWTPGELAGHIEFRTVIEVPQ